MHQMISTISQKETPLNQFAWKLISFMKSLLTYQTPNWVHGRKTVKTWNLQKFTEYDQQGALKNLALQFFPILGKFDITIGLKDKYFFYKQQVCKESSSTIFSNPWKIWYHNRSERQIFLLQTAGK